MDTSNWKWFRYDEIFDIRHGFYNKKPEDNPDGDIPFIGATDSNNGVTSHSDLATIANTTKTGDGKNAPMEEKIFQNCIVVTNNGSVGYAYYQAKPFTCTHDVNPLYLKGHEINPYIALFLCTIIEKERFRWAYGRKWRPIRMPSSLMKLPAIEQDNGNFAPDWQYMEDYIKNTIIPQLPVKAKQVWKKVYNVLPIIPAEIQLGSRNWKWFRYDEIFNIRHGFYNKKPEDNLDGGIPFIGATDSNNGVTSHSDLETIDNTTKTGDDNNAPLEEKIFPANCITVSNDGSVGFAFFQNKEFTCSHSVNPLYLKDHELNPYIALFLCTIIEKERFRWAYGRKWRPVRMPSSKIKLPVTSGGTPDWQFMEDYIKSLPYSRNIE